MSDKVRDEQLDDLKDVLKSQSGRRLIWRFIEPVTRATYVRGDSDATAFNEGMRGVGILIMSDVLEACPDRYMQMQREARKRIEEFENGRDDD